MPYITPSERAEMDISGYDPDTAGQLNYCITSVVDAWLGQERLSYDRINAAVGVLECAKQELYRRIATPFETSKLAANGDVYTFGWEDV